MIQFAKGVALCLSGSFAGKLILLLSTIILARLLSPADLGLYFLGISFNSVLSVIATGGFRIGTVRYVSLYHSENNLPAMRGVILASSTVSLSISILLAFLLVLNSKWMVIKLFGKPEFLSIITLFIVAIPTEAQRLIFTASTEGMKIMRYSIFVNQVLFNFIQMLLFVLLIYIFGLGLWGAALSFLTASTICTIVAILTTNRHVKLICFKEKTHLEFRALMRFSVTMLPASLLFNASRQIDVLLLGALGTAPMVGIYSIAVRLTNFCETIFNAFQQVLNPYIADYHLKNDKRKLNEIFNFSIKWCFIISMPLFLFFCFYPSYFLGIFNETIIQGAICLSILSAGHQLSSMSNIASSLISMAGYPRISLLNNTVYIIMCIILNLILIPSLGLIGAAFAHTVAILLLTTLRFTQAYRLFNLQPFNLMLLKAWISGLLAIIITMIIYGFNGIQHSGHFVFALLVFCIVFFTLIISWVMNKKEFNLFRSLRSVPIRETL